MRAIRGFVCAVAVCVTLARAANADVVGSAAMLEFGQLAGTASLVTDLSRFVYIPVIGSWLDVGKLGAPQGGLVLDALCQDIVGLIFMTTAFDRHDAPVHVATWSFAPWFPQSGGGGLSLRATF